MGMEKQQAVLTILFADVAKSTRIYEMLGDRTAQALIATILGKLAQVTTRNGGQVIKTIGDEIMCTFPSPNEAVDAARVMHESLKNISMPERPGFIPPNIYVGLHMGTVILQDGDVFGDAVNVASRMATLAKPRQILTTEETVNMLAPESRKCAQWVDKTTIKGKAGVLKIYEVVWERQDQTVMVDSLMESKAFRFRLEIRYKNMVVEVDQDQPSATLGRQSHNDIVVDDSRVSRTHARIDYRRGRFILVDQSSNGTFVLPDGGKGAKLKRDETPLIGKGVIALGRMPDPDSSENIRYRIKS